MLQGKRKGENGLSKWPEWEAVMKISGWCVFQKEAAAHAVPGRLRDPSAP